MIKPWEDVDSKISRMLDVIDRHSPEACVIYTSVYAEQMNAHGLTGKGESMYGESVMG